MLVKDHVLITGVVKKGKNWFSRGVATIYTRVYTYGKLENPTNSYIYWRKASFYGLFKPGGLTEFFSLRCRIL